MGLKDAETAIVAEWAVKGWLTYIQAVTRDLPITAPVEERWNMAMAGEELPPWLHDALWSRLVSSRGEALVARVLARCSVTVGTPELVDTDLPDSRA